MTELATLEKKPLSDLHQIAAQLGIKQYRKYRKPALAELIYKTATDQAGGQQEADIPAAAPSPAPETAVNGQNSTAASEAAAPAAPIEPVADAAALNGSSSGAAGSVQEEARTEAPAVEAPESANGAAPEAERQQQRREGRGEGRRDRRGEKGERGDRRERDGQQQGGEGQSQSGILDVLPDGFGFLRTNGYSQGKGDVYVSASQIKRFGLRRGDLVVGQIRPARDGEKYPALVRIETVNGQEPQKGRYRPSFDDLTPLYPNERLRLEWKPNDIAPRGL